MQSIKLDVIFYISQSSRGLHGINFFFHIYSSINLIIVKMSQRQTQASHVHTPGITKHDMLLFYDRPTEPCFMLKGRDSYYFKMPEKYFPEKYKKMWKEITDPFEKQAHRTIQVKDITAMPDLSLPKELPYCAHFSLFIPKHRRMAGRLIDAFMQMKSVEDFFSLSSYCQMIINPYLFNYCLSVAIMHRKDTTGVTVPNLAESFPDKFIDPIAFRRARESNSVLPAGSRLPIEIPRDYTASDLEPEQRLGYWREDIGLNLHHWHWHLVYPFDAADTTIVNKDRRGELFSYMHQQITARYNIERTCNGLAGVTRFNEFREPIVEGYFPKLDSLVASRNWPPRFIETYLSDLDRSADDIRLEIAQVEIWRDRIITAIENGWIVLPDGKRKYLDELTGIDTLGNMVESSIISPNRAFYGDLHNSGHLLISYAHDPDGRHLELFGVMGDTATAMRDPTFYRWHAFIDDIFNLHKMKLPPYTDKKLNFPGIRIKSFDIEGVAGTNNIATLWEQSTMELGRGLDFTERGSILARFTHLQHEDFRYRIVVENTNKKGMSGTIRIFMGPVHDQSGRPLKLEEQRRLMVELDKFSHPLPTGTTTITRRSLESTVTIPYAKTFRNQLDRQGEPGSQQAAQFDFCGCGWPHHLLVCKGTETGQHMVLFVMISNWNEDKIDQDLVGTCNGAPGYCGVKDRKYPDRQSMGYPFNRPIQPKVKTLEGFLHPNMATQRITITFKNITRQRKQKRYEDDDLKQDQSVDTSQ